MLKLAGNRINPGTNGPHLAPRTTGLVLQTIATGDQRRVPTPDGANLGFQGWSPNGEWIAFTATRQNGIELHVVSVRDLTTKSFEAVRINSAFGTPIQWLPDSSGLLVQAIPSKSRPGPGETSSAKRPDD